MRYYSPFEGVEHNPDPMGYGKSGSYGLHNVIEATPSEVNVIESVWKKDEARAGSKDREHVGGNVDYGRLDPRAPKQRKRNSDESVVAENGAKKASGYRNEVCDLCKGNGGKGCACQGCGLSGGLSGGLLGGLLNFGGKCGCGCGCKSKDSQGSLIIMCVLLLICSEGIDEKNLPLLLALMYVMTG
ncbi:MAG: hypothetical protein LBM38_02360 [Clostridiales bacterium]|jgi:hypothetical protein|nr:hypothetical protein [Clostridiales bacterium]